MVLSLLRKCVKYVGAHRVLSVILLTAAIGLVVFARSYVGRSSGLLTEPIKRGEIAETVYGIGTIIANQSMQIRPGQVSNIDRYFCKEGDFVKKGAPLLTMNGITSRAPFSGTVTSLPYKIRENVFPQSSVLTLTNLDDRYMTVSLEQAGALRIRVGQKVKLSFDSIRTENFDGVVQSVYSSDNNFIARIDVGGLPATILPGMTADVAILIRTAQNVLLVPVAALVGGQVWVKHGRGVPALATVKTGIIDKDLAEVLSGDVAEGDRLLIKGSSSK